VSLKASGTVGEKLCGYSLLGKHRLLAPVEQQNPSYSLRICGNPFLGENLEAISSPTLFFSFGQTVITVLKFRRKALYLGKISRTPPPRSVCTSGGRILKIPM